MNQPTRDLGDGEVAVTDQTDPAGTDAGTEIIEPEIVELVGLDSSDSVGVAGGLGPDAAADESEQAADNFLADLQRVSAEFANYRRQTEKRHGELVQQAGSRLALKLLPVLDALDAAMAHQTEGVEPIRAQLLSVLEREGLELIGSEAEVFDPSRHEAAMHEPADDNDDTPIVSEVLRPGYAWNGRVLRAAMVKVKG